MIAHQPAFQALKTSVCPSLCLATVQKAMRRYVTTQTLTPCTSHHSCSISCSCRPFIHTETGATVFPSQPASGHQENILSVWGLVSVATYFLHPPHLCGSACPARPAGKARCPAPRPCQCRCWSGTWWPGSGGKQRWRCPQCWQMSSLGKLRKRGKTKPKSLVALEINSKPSILVTLGTSFCLD